MQPSVKPRLATHQISLLDLGEREKLETFFRVVDYRLIGRNVHFT